MIVEKIPEEKEHKFFINVKIPEEQVNFYKGYYQCAYVMMRFNNEVCVVIKEEQAGVEDDHDEEEMEDVKLDNERERHWSIYF